MASEPEEVVISGISGKFPECFSVDELKEKLFSKSILIKPDEERNLPINDPGKLFAGKIPEWNAFDNMFFGIMPGMVKYSEPMCGLIMERAFEAILDAGINPFSLKGRNIAVFSAPSCSDTESLSGSEASLQYSAALVGTARTMTANRIAFFYNFNGPSFSTEGSWVTSAQSLERAVHMISTGMVEAAVVNAASLLLYTTIDREYRHIGILSDDGFCQPFDAEGHGFARSEAAVTFFIQRRRDAKRIYSTVKNIKTKFMGAKTCGFLQFDPQIEIFLKDFYKNANERPEEVSYIEAHGTCHRETDKQELNALARVYCSNEKTQLIGSITGNVGHADNSSGLVSMVKALIAMETGTIPPTVNYHSPNPNVPALVSGKLQPVTENTELPGDLVAVNNISRYGAISHALLKRHDKVKRSLAPKELPEVGLPRLVLLQARHQEGANVVCDKVASMSVDVEFVSLVNDVFKTQIPAYLWKGYAIVPTIDEKPIMKIQKFKPEKRPIVYVFSGMGSQWTGMGTELLKIPVFNSSILKCDKVLRPKGLDIVNILSSTDQDISDKILNCFVGITAIQIGLVDVLSSLNITPDCLIGHSLGELACSYADGCLTAEQAILTAYSRGKASLAHEDQIKGSMAAVGIGYQDIKDMLPPCVDVACHNSADGCTVSGPKSDVIAFVDKLKKAGVFAKAVNCGGMAFHSRYMKCAGPYLLKKLKEILPHPKPRSSKWISTSVPESQWATDSAKLCSPEYHTNNVLNPVYFEEGCRHLPKNAIIIEIAPHGLLQAILRRSVSSGCLNVSLTNRTVPSNLNHFLECLGQLYLNNVSLDINALYPKVEYPVSRGTPSLAPLATWNHETEHYSDYLSIINMYYKKGVIGNELIVHPSNPDYHLWRDQRIAGHVTLTPAQILMYPWEMILSSRRQKIEEHFTVIEDVTIVDNVIISEQERVLYTTFSPVSLKFEVSYTIDGNVEVGNDILSGRLVADLYSKPQPLGVPPPVEDLSAMERISEADVYYMLANLGCSLGPQFRNIKQLYIGKKGCLAKVRWNGKLVTFLDAVMKVAVIFKSRIQGILLRPNSFTKLIVDGSFLSSLSPGTVLDVYYQSGCNKVSCQGAELIGLSLVSALPSDPYPLAWSQTRFQPYFDDETKVEEFLSFCVQTAAEDDFKSWSRDSCTINILVLNTDSYSNFIQLFKNYDVNNIEVKISQVSLAKAKKMASQLGEQSLIVVGDRGSLASAANHCEEASRLYCITSHAQNGSPKCQNFRQISSLTTDSGTLFLLKKVKPSSKLKVYKTESSGWLDDLRMLVEEEKNDTQLVFVSRTLAPRQVLPVLSKEPYTQRVRTVFIQDCNAPQFSLTTPLYSNQLSLGLSVNIFSRGTWGSLRTVPLDVSPCTLHLDSLKTRSKEDLTVNCVGLNTTYFELLHEPSTSEPELNCVDYVGVSNGQRVMGVALYDPGSNSLCPDPVLRWPVPASWNVEDAVTVPALYSLAYYSIKVRAKVEEGETVLVHAGMSPVGQTIIAVALQAGAKVLASVTDEEEALLLTEIFPDVKSSQIFVLNEGDINADTRKKIGGKGVNVIVNCFRGRNLQSSINLALPFCRIIHFAEPKIEERETIGLYHFFHNRCAFGMSLNSIKNCTEDRKIDLCKSLKNGIEEGVVRPLRKRLFRCKELTNAFQNLKKNNTTEKTVLILKEESQVPGTNGFRKHSLDSVHIIAGKSVELKFELAEWLIHHGCRNLIFINDEERNNTRYLKRMNHIFHLNNSSAVVVPSSCLDTVQSARLFLQEIAQSGPVSSIFCVGMDENDMKMKNLDSASRHGLPSLKDFVSLLGSGSSICDSRASRRLPAISIQSEVPLEPAAKVLPYLFSLMAVTQKEATFFTVSDCNDKPKNQDELDDFVYLPNSTEELSAHGRCVESCARFVEEVTRSPPYATSKYNLLPVFAILGSGRNSVQRLLRQLIHPAFCCRLPLEPPSIEQLAELLVEDVKQIQPKGPYNILGESWGGALALTVGRLLEDRGDLVHLTLIQGVPTTTQDRLRALCRRYGADLGTCVLYKAFNTQAKGTQGSWRERLAQLLPTLEPDAQEPVSTAVTALFNQLNSFLEFEPSNQLYKGDVILIRNKNEHFYDLENLSKFCQSFPKIISIDENNHCDLLASFSTATAINENMAYTWWP